MSFLRGVGFGIFVTILIQAAVIYFVFIKLTSPKGRITKPSDGERPGNLPEQQGEAEQMKWPEAVTERLKRWLTPNSLDVAVESQPERNNSLPAVEPLMKTPTVEADWLNLILTRVFVTLRSSKVFQKRWAMKMSNKINLKLKGNSFVSKLVITEVKLGDHPPSIEGVRLLKGITKDLAVSGEFDLIYRGGASISIQTTITNGSVIPMQVFMNEFNGTVRTRLPSKRWSDMLGFAFLDDPGVTFRVESSITVADNQILRNMVNSVLSTIMRKTFLELWVLPSWRTAFLPLLEPSLDDWLARQEEDKAIDQAKKAKITMASRASQLWESSPLAPNLQSLLKRPGVEKLKDCLEGVVFDTHSILPKANAEIAEYFEMPLAQAFIDMATSAATEDHGNTKSSKSDDDEFVPGSPPGTSSQLASWKTVKNKMDIMLQKRRTVDPDLGSVSEVTRASIPISCDISRVFAILSNPVHFRHIYDNFIDSKLLFEDGDNVAHTCSFQFGKSEKSFQVYQAKSNSADSAFRYVVMRSISGIAGGDEEALELETTGSFTMVSEPDAGTSETVRQRKSKPSPSQSVSVSEPSIESESVISPVLKTHKSSSSSNMETDSLVYIFGYHITKVTDTTCLVTVLSQFSPSLHKLEVDASFCRKLKQFIEELTQLTDGEAHEPQSKITGIKKILSAENEKKVREKLASYLGTAKSFLQKGKSSVGSEILAPLTSPLPLEERTSPLLEESALDLYVERTLASKEIFSVDIPFIREKYGEHVNFKWDYVCRSEQNPAFSIHFIPDDPDDASEITNLLPFAGTRGRVLVPLSHIQCYSKPSRGLISVSKFRSGKFVLSWENNLPLSMRSSKVINYQAFFTGGIQAPEAHAQVAIPRKSYFSLPIIFENRLEDPHDIRIEFSSGNVNVPFALYFDQAIEDNVVPSVSDRLKRATSGSNLPDAAGHRSRKTLIQFNSTKISSIPPKTIHVVPSDAAGVYTAVWDNSASVVSTRHIVFHIDFIKRAQSASK